MTYLFLNKFYLFIKQAKLNSYFTDIYLSVQNVVALKFL